MGNYSSLKLNRRIFAVLWLCIFSFCLYAQENRSYIVTAARDTEEAFEAAGNVIVITSDDIEKSGKSSLVEILENVANIQLSSISGTNQDAQVNMRGFGENAFGRVLVMIDGRRLNNPDMSAVNLNAVPVESIDRIEILDGSASALYGDNAVGGVINIITKESTQPLSLVGGLSVGNNWTTGTHFGYTASEGYSGFSMNTLQMLKGILALVCLLIIQAQTVGVNAQKTKHLMRLFPVMLMLQIKLRLGRFLT